MEQKQKDVDHAHLATIKSREAHESWLLALRAQDDGEKHAETMRRGDDAWLAAEHHLRMAGVDGQPASEDERETLLTDPCFTLTGHVAQEPEPIDFKPLQRAYYVSLAVKTVNRIFLVGLIFGFAYLAGYGAGREAGAYPTAEQMQQQFQQHKGGKELNHEQKSNRVAQKTRTSRS